MAALRRKRTCFRPSASSRRKGVLRFLREASPQAGWRLSEGSELVLKKARPSASFGKLHLWRLSEGSELVLKKARPSASFGKLHLWRLSEGSELVSVLRLSERSSASFGKLHLWRGGGFPKEANFFQKASPLAASFGKLATRRKLASRRTCVLPKEGKKPARGEASRRKHVPRQR